MIRRTVWPGQVIFCLNPRSEARRLRSRTLSGIFFQMVILKNVQLITGARNITALIDDGIDSWNRGAFDKIVCESYAAAIDYLGRSHGNQNAEQRHRTFSNLFQRGKLRDDVIFFYKWETGGILKPNELASGKMGVMEETVAMVLVGKHLHEPPPRYTLEVYKKTPIFIPAEITEDVVESVTWKISGILGPGGTDLEAL